MIKKITKLTLENLIENDWKIKEPWTKFGTETDIIHEPVRVNSFIKRKDDYFFVTKIAPFENAPFMVDGYSVNIQQYRHFIISEILGPDMI